MKRHRESTPPPGALERVRNVRLYGSRDEQAAGSALRARGCPNPDRALVRRPRKTGALITRTVPAAPAAPLALRVESARRNWQVAVNRVRKLRAEGQDATEAVARARALRHALLALDPDAGFQGHVIELAQASDANKIKAAA